MEPQVFDILGHYPDFLECLAARHAKLVSNFKSTDEELNELREIRDAVERLKRLEYAFCADCLSPIALQEVIAAPYTKVCRDCAVALPDELRAS